MLVSKEMTEMPMEGSTDRHIHINFRKKIELVWCKCVDIKLHFTIHKLLYLLSIFQLSWVSSLYVFGQIILLMLDVHFHLQRPLWSQDHDSILQQAEIQSQKIPRESLQHWLWVLQKTVRMAYGNEMWMKCISTELSVLEDNWSQKASLDLVFYFHWKTISSMRVVTGNSVLMVLTCGLAQHSRTRNGKKDVCWYIWFNMLSLDQLANSKDEQLTVFFFCISTESSWAGFREIPRMLTALVR